jgi:hypothetical protein
VQPPVPEPGELEPGELQPDVLDLEPDVVGPEPDVVGPEPDGGGPEPDGGGPEPDLVEREPDVTEHQLAIEHEPVAAVPPPAEEVAWPDPVPQPLTGYAAPEPAVGDAPEGAGAERPAREAPRGRVWLGVTSTVLAVAVVAVAVLVWLVHDRLDNRRALERERKAAGTAAAQTFVDLLTVDYRDPAGYVRRLQGDTTGTMHDEIARDRDILFSNFFVPQQERLTGTTAKVAATITNSSSTSARALVVGSARIVTKALPAGQLQAAGFTMLLSRVGGRWLVNDAKPVQGQPAGTPTATPSTAPSATPSPSALSAAPTSPTVRP